MSVNIEEEIKRHLKVMEDKVGTELCKSCIGNKKEYIPCQKMINEYSGSEKGIFQRRLWDLIPYLDFHN